MPTVELSQGRIHYAEDGDGPTVVLLHGVLVGGSLWRDVVAELRATHRVVVPELPLGAHPQAMRPDADLSPLGLAALVAEFLEALGLDDVTLSGNDTGGAIAQLVAAHHPQRVSGLALTNCDMLDVFPPAFFKPLIRAIQLPGVLPAIARSLGFAPLRNSPLGLGWLTKKGVPDEVSAVWARNGRDADVQRDVKRFVAGASTQLTERAADLLAASGIPILLVWGQDDRFFTTDLARRYAQRVPQTRIEPVADSFAFVPADQPAAVAAHIARFAGAPAQVPATP